MRYDGTLDDGEQARPESSGGLVKLMRHFAEELLSGKLRRQCGDELLSRSPMDFALLTWIALRVLWKGGSFKGITLEAGEALIGDWDEYGMSQKQYRTAKKILEKMEFAAFRRANRGT